MKKSNAYSVLKRLLSVCLCLGMVSSMVLGTGLSDIFDSVENVIAEAAEDEYKNETLEHMWDSDGDSKPDDDFLDAARPYYACRNGSFGGVEYRTIFHVYAFEGDTICVGSSVYNSMLNLNHSVGTNTADEGSIDVVMTDLNGNAHAIDIRNTGDDKTGYIGNWQTEYAAVSKLHKEDGKFSGTYKDGETNYTYTPYTYTVTETGVYTFEFHSYNKSNAVSDKKGYRKRREPFHDPTTNYGGEIAALNLTVFDESGEEQHGRTYADFLSMQMHPDSIGVVDTYYILTTDSYIYKMKFNDAKPYTYNFFANNKGIYDSATGEIIYTSVKDINNDNTFDEMGAAYKYPGTKDTDTLKSFYIFLEYPDDQLEGELYEKAVQPDPATNLRFVSEIKDDDGNNIPGAYEGEGGYFAFDVEEATTATLRLEFKGIKGDTYAPVEISGAVTPHSTNYFYWNGKDGEGKDILSGNYKIEDLAFTVTTKAGEIHFPIIDMEHASKGITFTRLSHIYNKEGVRKDYDDNIYGKTKNVIYYDDTAIYYGEYAASTGFSEKDVTLAQNTTSDAYAVNDAPKNYFEKVRSGSVTKKYWTYNNMRSDGGEYIARHKAGYLTNPDDDTLIRVGDHSHTTNVINYFDGSGNLVNTPTTDQQNMINYLDSDKFPVGKSVGTGIYYGSASSKYTDDNVISAQTTTDYAIANFWTFIPSQPAKASIELDNIKIKERPENSFSLTGRVFFDATKNGIFDDMMAAGDYPLRDVKLNLYRKTEDTSFIDGKIYVDSEGEPLDASTFASTEKKYELVDTGLTTGEGMYKFTGLTYDPGNGTEYLYQVIKPGNIYNLTSGGQEAKPLTRAPEYKPFGYYADKSYGTSYKGTEVQHIVVGEKAGQVNPKIYGYGGDKPDGNTTVCAVDVGYNYKILAQSLVLKKTWDTTGTHPTAVVYEVHYKQKGSSTEGVYAYRTMSAITSWQYEDEYLPEQYNGVDVDNYYVAAEYYIDAEGKYIYKHEFSYDIGTGKYKSFVGNVYKALITDPALDGAKNFSNISDLSVLQKVDWGTALDEKDATYRGVLDRNISSDSTTVTITNSENHGTIEIFKYQGTNTESNALQGATFRVYELKDSKTVEDIKKLVESGDTAELKKYEVGSATTRSNGRIAFPGLNPENSYVVREVFAPAGYRILNEFYVVRAKTEKLPTEDEKTQGIYKFDDDNYVKVDVGNATADKNFFIVKQIEGRSWQGADTVAGIDADSFSFTIINKFDNSVTNLSDADGIKVDLNELEILNIQENEARTKAGEFANNFKAGATGTKNKITVDYSKPYYHYTAKDSMDKDYEYTFPDRKMSDSLLVDGSDETTVASFCSVVFPMAGEYTFTITEDDINIAGDETLTKSSLEYTVKINVKRELNQGVDESTEKTEDNSHLIAEISSITYKDTSVEGSTSQVFAGNSPVFTNIYAPAPAKQSTSYKIVKNFTGREGNEWAETDKFTVHISGNDTVTQEAIANGNLVIEGLNAELKETGTTKEWVHVFNKINNGELEFKSFMFNNTMFPVQYVEESTGKVWNPEEHDGQQSPSAEDIARDKYKAETLPVTYWLKIKEDIPSDAIGNVQDGITYDGSVYYLQIVLRNTEAKKEGTDSEEEDGIIDEIDMTLYHSESEKAVSELTADERVATCLTKAEVLTADEWIKDATPADGKYTWFYVDKNGTLREVSNHSTVPTDAKLLVRRWEKHDGKSDGHTMTINNVYHTTYKWIPKVKKNLAGREWAEGDEFTFTLECTKAPRVSEMSGLEKKIIITKEDKEADFTKAFEEIEFTVPGDYEFTITESSVATSITTTAKNIVKDSTSGIYTIKVTFVDNNDGTLTPTFNGYSADAAVEFINAYSDTEKDFDLNISKELVGRNWNDEDEFTFKITPDSETLDAINSGDLVMDNTKLGELNATDNSYTVIVKKDSASVTDTVVKSLGKIKVKKGAEEEKEYHFTIAEVVPDNMHCLEPKIDLTINVNRVKDSVSKLPTGELEVSATYAYMREPGSSTKPSGETPKTDDITIPFTNECMGTLTVAKKVVSSADTDTQDFNFEVNFTFKDGFNAARMVAKHSGKVETITPTTDTGSATYTFTLKDGENVVFSNIPPYTAYTVTEDPVPDDYMLLRVRDSAEDEGYDLLTAAGGSSNSVEGEITGDSSAHYRMFVNGRIKALPSSGGIGINKHIFFGTMLTVAAVLLAAMRYMKRVKRSSRRDING